MSVNVNCLPGDIIPTRCYMQQSLIYTAACVREAPSHCRPTAGPLQGSLSRPHTTCLSPAPSLAWRLSCLSEASPGQRKPAGSSHTPSLPLSMRHQERKLREGGQGEIGSSRHDEFSHLCNGGCLLGVVQGGPQGHQPGGVDQLLNPGP